VLLYHCTDPSCEAFDAVFFPSSGTLDVTALAQADTGRFQGKLTAVHWDEVDIDPDSLESTPIFRGDCFDLSAEYTMDATVEPFPPDPP
jgi:hypothetical protein